MFVDIIVLALGALFTALGAESHDLGMQSGLLEQTG